MPAFRKYPIFGLVTGESWQSNMRGFRLNSLIRAVKVRDSRIDPK